MKIRLVGSMLIGLCFLLAHAQTLEEVAGTWQGAIEIPGSPLEVTVTLEAAVDGLGGTVDIPAQGASGLPLRDVTLAGEVLSFVIDGINGEPTFEGTVSGDSVAGAFSQGGQEFPFSLVRGEASAAPPDFTWSESVASKDVTFRFSDGWEAAGMVSYPADAQGPFPTLVLYHGSGSNDMDQTLPGAPEGSKIFRQLAAYLAERGFAVVRYNKRGVTGTGPELASEQPEGGYAMDQYISDGEEVLEAAQSFEQVDPERIILLGHSEGTVTASALARSHEEVAGLALMGVLGYDIRDVLRFQILENSVLPSLAELDTDGDAALSSKEVSTFLDGAPEVAVNQLTQALGLSATGDTFTFSSASDQDGDGRLDLESEVRPFVESVYGDEFLRTSGFDEFTWLNSLQEVGNVTTLLPGFEKPVLMLNGEADIQTVVAGARAAFAALEAAGNTEATLITYPGLGHTFYPAGGLEQPLGPMEDEVLQDLGDWLSERFLSG